MMTQTLTRVKFEVRFVQSIVVLPHLHADGDALGASFAFAALMQEEGKDVTVVLEELPPPNLLFLCDRFVLSDDARLDGAVFDMAVAMDCGDDKRLGKRKGLFDRAGQTVCIDHHMTNQGFAQINVIEGQASSTSELICDLYKEYERKPLLRAAEQLYAGLSTDTGSFRFSNTTEKALSYAALMVRRGISVADVCGTIWETASPAALKLKARALNALTIYGDRQDIAGIVLTQKDFEETGATDFDTEGFAGLAGGFGRNGLRRFRGGDAGRSFRSLRHDLDRRLHFGCRSRSIGGGRSRRTETDGLLDAGNGSGRSRIDMGHRLRCGRGGFCRDIGRRCGRSHGFEFDRGARTDVLGSVHRNIGSRICHGCFLPGWVQTIITGKYITLSRKDKSFFAFLQKKR